MTRALHHGATLVVEKREKASTAGQDRYPPRPDTSESFHRVLTFMLKLVKEESELSRRGGGIRQRARGWSTVQNLVSTLSAIYL